VGLESLGASVDASGGGPESAPASSTASQTLGMQLEPIAVVRQLAPAPQVDELVQG
jgi:hypothetical protein